MNNIWFLIFISTIVESFFDGTVSVGVFDRLDLFNVFNLDGVHHFNVEATTLDVVDRLILVLKRSTEDLLLTPSSSHPSYLLWTWIQTKVTVFDWNLIICIINRVLMSNCRSICTFIKFVIVWRFITFFYISIAVILLLLLWCARGPYRVR